MGQAGFWALRSWQGTQRPSALMEWMFGMEIQVINM